MVIITGNYVKRLRSRQVLQLQDSSGIFDPGPPSLKMIGCICVVYCVLFFSLFKGVKSSGTYAESQEKFDLLRELFPIR